MSDCTEEFEDHNQDGPEEVSVLLTRGSRVAKDFDMLRFSKASSVEQNFLVDGELDSRNGLHQGSQEQLLDRKERSPMTLRRVPKQVQKKQTAMSVRKLTNSLFEEKSSEPYRVINEEEEKERDE